jgi:hypothetical protein
VSTQTLSSAAARLHAIWSTLPSGTLTEPQFLAAITTALNRPGPGHEADVSAIRHALVGSQAVITTGNGPGLTCTRAESFPEWRDPTSLGPGSPEFDRQTDELRAAERVVADRATEETFLTSPQNRERAAMIALIDERIERRLGELRRAADGAAVTRARELLRRQTAGAGVPATTTRPG